MSRWPSVTLGNERLFPRKERRKTVEGDDRNDFLCQEDLSCPDGRVWHLTMKGFSHAKKGEKQLKETTEVKMVQKRHDSSKLTVFVRDVLKTL
ncbi:hypothetical protein CDAR_367501 [Caerostris darwini]|uniref:Uncharacterized protein n=1 Tax=Caerostris darwini TaxID=1538125 RepID=A0AAV4VBY3_9ARAC|nr:hypothetical protein CDAR_367501 [Caerostris darwini]